MHLIDMIGQDFFQGQMPIGDMKSQQAIIFQFLTYSSIASRVNKWVGTASELKASIISKSKL